MKEKLAIIGAGYLQKPLVEKANNLGIETHVFAWREGCVVDDIADFYYPISIINKEEILEVCAKVQIDGIVSIASDIAMPSVNFIADKLHLVGNSIEATEISTNKFKMRSALKKDGIRSPKFELFSQPDFTGAEGFEFPLIVKPVDRSGSRGVTKVNSIDQVNQAIKKALSHSLNGQSIVEEFILGQEYSVEGISYDGQCHILAITEKDTTGPPFFVEQQHHQPALITEIQKKNIISTIKRALTALSIEYGASHTEIFIGQNDEITIGEVAGRMGGDFIGSHLVELSTGYDYLKGVIDIALGRFDKIEKKINNPQYSGVYFITPKAGVITDIIDRSKDFEEMVECIGLKSIGDRIEDEVQDSSMRAGLLVYKSKEGRLEIDPANVLDIRTSKHKP